MDETKTQPTLMAIKSASLLFSGPLVTFRAFKQSGPRALRGIANSEFGNAIKSLEESGLGKVRTVQVILGDPAAASRDDGIFMGESLQQERESPWALTLTERVPEAFEIPPSDWPEKYFSGQSAKRNSRATLMSSYTRLLSSSNVVVVAWPVQHF